jgi:SAM-dependent methyltransferase
MEVGCADSVILPFIHSLGYRTVGIDYSQVGCDKFAAQSPGSRVVCADMFSPPQDLIGSVDAVISMGLVEHFSDTGAAVAALAGFLKPGGIMLTVVPNMYGTVGLLQRSLNRAAYDVHIRLTPDDLARAHAGLNDVRAGYLSAMGYGVVNHGYRWPGRGIVGALARVSNMVARLDSRLALPRTQAFSPHCYCTAVKPSE